jgi:Family of unknown function (DUF7009)
MKIRLKGNSVRMRLSKTEVEKLTAEGYLEEQTSFGKNTFVYALRSKPDISELSAEYYDRKITLFIPESFIKNWEVNDVVGFDANVNIGSNEKLYLLVEKDFKCINETEEDQSDNFENPGVC